MSCTSLQQKGEGQGRGRGGERRRGKQEGTTITHVVQASVCASEQDEAALSLRGSGFCATRYSLELLLSLADELSVALQAGHLTVQVPQQLFNLTSPVSL